ncbi:MAG: NOL1/NOP2/sun family putative RNA methylase [bacterium JZ-2024 1]
MVERYRRILGEETEQFFSSLLKPLPKALRVNTLKISRENFLLLAQRRDWRLTPVPWCREGFFIDRENREIPLGKTPEHYAGLFYLQDASSMLPVEILQPGRGEKILDLTSAPGGKATHIAGKIFPTGILFANDISVKRLKALNFNVDRLGALNTIISQINAHQMGKFFPDTFDRVLLDAPCSAEGTIPRSLFALQHWSPRIIQKMARNQVSLLLSAFRALKPGGTLVYSTCTLTPEENEIVLHSLLKKFPGNAEILKVDPPGFTPSSGLTSWNGETFHPSIRFSLRIWPHRHGTEGFFTAALTKKMETPVPRQERVFSQPEFRPLSAFERKSLIGLLQKRFAFPSEILDDYELVKIGKSIWLWTPHILRVASSFPFVRAGLRLIRRIDSSFIPKITTFSAHLIAPYATRNVLSLSQEQAFALLQAQNVPLSPQQSSRVENGLVLLRYEDVFLGVSEKKGDLLKNTLPHDTLPL